LHIHHMCAPGHDCSEIPIGIRESLIRVLCLDMQGVWTASSKH
jgi:hypothetical protein